jgi:eukaryotic-like serine/threonine-protein kinase
VGTAGNGRQQRAGSSSRPLRPLSQGPQLRYAKGRRGAPAASSSGLLASDASEADEAVDAGPTSPESGDEPRAQDDSIAGELKAQARERIGQTLKGKWTLDHLLGVGGMAAVYAATHRNGNRVAIKMLHAALGGHGVLRERFLREGYAANRVEHPGVARVLDDDVAEDGTPFLTMELLSGETLEARWRRHSRLLPLAEVLAIADELLAVLASAHARGIHHRDIKPENVFLTRAGRVKILDFGIARVREGLPGGITATRTGALLGTPAFMPPEQARGRGHEVDGRSDIWAVGATMFTLLSGRFVHVSAFANEMLILAATERAPSLLAGWPFAPAEVVALVDRALAFERDARFEDAAQMRGAIHAAQRALRLPPTELALSTALSDVSLPPPRPLSTTCPTLASEASPSPLPAVLSAPPPASTTSPSALSLAPPSLAPPSLAPPSQGPSALAFLPAGWRPAALLALLVPLGIFLALAPPARRPVDPPAPVAACAPEAAPSLAALSADAPVPASASAPPAAQPEAPAHGKEARLDDARPEAAHQAASASTHAPSPPHASSPPHAWTPKPRKGAPVVGRARAGKSRTGR